MPRATTAACEVVPPRAVRMPSAATMPWMSSGLVSVRTRIAGSPCSARPSAASAGGERDPPHRCAWRSRQPRGDHALAARPRRTSGCSSSSSRSGSWRQQRRPVRRSRPRPRGRRRSSPSRGRCARRCGSGGSTAGPAGSVNSMSCISRKCRLQRGAGALEVRERRRHQPPRTRVARPRLTVGGEDRLRGADAGYHVLALRVRSGTRR